MFFKKKPDEFFLKMRQSYAAQLKRKDDEIAKLKNENEILMRTALKQSENADKWREYSKKLEEKLDKSSKKKKSKA